MEDTLEYIISQEYRSWKKNVPFIYDLMISRGLEWPSLSVDWIPSAQDSSECLTHKLVVGTHTDKAEQEYLIVMNVRLPPKSIVNSSEEDPPKPPENKIEPYIYIAHEGEANRIRVMPQSLNGCILATKAANSEVCMYNYMKHPARPMGKIGPQLRLTGHTKEGFGLDWNHQHRGYIASGSDDHLVCIWNTETTEAYNNQVLPLAKYAEHTDVVEDVSWNVQLPYQLASVGDDRQVILWDIRQSASTFKMNAHEGDINSVDFNKRNQNLLATGSTDSIVKIWDTRYINQPIANLDKHEGAVEMVQWAPFSEHLLASSGGDRRLMIWDSRRISEGADETLAFVHGGHTANITDFSWNQLEPMVIASVAEDNILQVWKPSLSDTFL